MSNVINTACPGCKKVLRVPADWVNKNIRCKFCNTTMQIKASTAPKVPTVPGVTAAKQPQTANRPVSSTPPAPSQTASQSKPLNSPMPEVANQNPLDFDEIPGASKRKKKAGAWIVPAVLALVLFTIGGVGAVFVLKFANDKKTTVADGSGQLDPKYSEDKNEADSPKKKAAASEKTGGEKGAAATNAKFPRRAMLVSVHNYFYANPIQYGITVAGAKNIPKLVDFFKNQFRVPGDQVIHLSDVAKDNPVPPTKGVIEATISDYLKTSRKQDRVMLVFIGHAVENDGKVYLAPIEGDLTAPAGLIPLEWLYKELKECPARQKLLVLDVCRYNPAQGFERPGGDPMSAKMEEVIKAVPEGVQVITACSVDQRSMETDGEPLGVFMDAFYTVMQKGIQGKIQKVSDGIPVEEIFESIKKRVGEVVAEQGFKQVPKIFGSIKDNGAEYDAAEKFPEKIKIAGAPKANPESVKFMKTVFEEISTPPVKATNADSSIKFEYLPPVPDKFIKDYAVSNEPETELQKAVKQARVELWAISSVDEKELPADIKASVVATRNKIKVNLNVLKDGYRVPGNENTFKAGIEKDEKEVALMMLGLTEALDALKKLDEKKDEESKRWQANYDFVLARLEAQVAYLYEYQSALGQMRKELPAHDPKIHGGWKLASTIKLQGDSAGKKLAKESNGILEKLAKAVPGSPWEVMAKREKFTALGLEWQATK